MRSLVITALILIATLYSLMLPEDSIAESRRGPPCFGSLAHPDHGPEFDKNRSNGRLRTDQLGEYLAWRDYQMNMQKHYRIMEKYGGGTPLPVYIPAYRAQPRYGFRHRHGRTTVRSGARR